MDMIGAKTQEQVDKLQKFIDDMYQAIGKKDIAIVPQQKESSTKKFIMDLLMALVWKK